MQLSFNSAHLAALLSIASTFAVVANAQECATTWKCMPVTGSPPVLDADHSDWADVEAYTSSLVTTTGTEWDAGNPVLKCLYDENQIYFAFEIPGEYRFSTEDNKLCAAVATMMKVGEKATYLNMGGCPDAMGGCADGVPDTCSDYLVDIGGHWELKTTEQNTFYTSLNNSTGSGDDLIANNDDEYAVSPFCRFDDDDAQADNEWSGAWAHTNPVEGEPGVYHFEMSRTLKTNSAYSDAQLAAGDTVQFGVAFWDPFENEETGWSDIGHYITGCGLKWIDLELSDGSTPTEETPDSETATVPDSSAVSAFSWLAMPALAVLSLMSVY